MTHSRRKFIKNVAGSTAAIAIGGMGVGFSPKSYRRIIGANDRIRVAVIGSNGRGAGMAATFAKQDNTEVIYVCDVEEKARQKGINAVVKAGKDAPKGENDFRKMLLDKNVDATYIATPDHWHSPATILCCAAGKHVYCEKPLAHNPHEGEQSIAAARKYNRVVQMGSQRRSWKLLTEGINALHAGAIGKVHMAKCWYTNNRQSIGTGKVIPVPSNLDWNLWQGPAPREQYRDNIVHYNWHWFWNWGTGEALNNGTHEVDVARWGLGVDYPLRVNSTGGRYYYKDDWQPPDTQIITYDCPEATIVWEGRSCTPFKVQGLDRGVLFYGEKGVMLTGHDGYIIYDEKGNVLKDIKSNAVIDGRNASSPNEGLDGIHVANFLDSIRLSKKPNADVAIGFKSTLWVQLGNIAQRVGHTLNINQQNGHIVADKQAEALWGRTYEPGWQPVV